MHNSKGRTWSLILISLIIFIRSTNLLGLFSYSFTNRFIVIQMIYTSQHVTLSITDSNGSFGVVVWECGVWQALNSIPSTAKKKKKTPHKQKQHKTVSKIVFTYFS
jgi:hypothetical protein